MKKGWCTYILQPLEDRRHLAADLVATYGFISFNPKTGFISGSAIVNNVGNAAPDGSYTMRWFLSKDQIVNNADDIMLKEVRLGNTPAAGKSITRNDSPVVGYTVPDGSYFVGFAADVNSEIPENSDANNYYFTNAPVITISSQPIFANGTSGDDEITLSTGSDVDGNPQAVLTVNGNSSRYNPFRVAAVKLLGAGGNDQITVDAAMTLACSLEGGDGNDVLTGGSGDDTIAGNAGKDFIHGGDGRDRLNGNGGNDQLFGDAGADRLYGYNGNDYLDGGSSNDRLDGGDGSDILFGQGGADIFYTRDAFRDNLYGGTSIDQAQTNALDLLTSVERTIP